MSEVSLSLPGCPISLRSPWRTLSFKQAGNKIYEVEYPSMVVSLHKIPFSLICKLLYNLNIAEWWLPSGTSLLLGLVPTCTCCFQKDMTSSSSCAFLQSSTVKLETLVPSSTSQITSAVKHTDYTCEWSRVVLWQIACRDSFVTLIISPSKCFLLGKRDKRSASSLVLPGR